MNDLEMYREQLAICDDKIIDVLAERNSIIEKIMAYKEKYGMPILQPAQEEKQKRRLDEKLAGNKYQEEIEDVFRRILRNSKRIQARKLFPYNIVLIGFMGAGKTAISDFLSTMFDMRLVEMDQEISERQEMSIPDIFATYGEEYFRNLETELLKELRSENGCVISCGGGVTLYTAFFRQLRYALIIRRFQILHVCIYFVRPIISKEIVKIRPARTVGLLQCFLRFHR